MGEPSLGGFGGVVFQGEAKAGKSWRRGGAMGRTGADAGARCLVSQTERPGVERSTVCGGPNAKSEQSEDVSRGAGANGRVSGTEGFSG